MKNDTFYINENIRLLLFFIEIISAVILLIAAFFIWLRNKKDKDKFSFSSLVSFSVSLVLISDVMSLGFAGFPGITGKIMSIISNTGYFLSNNMAAWSIVGYVYELMNKNGRKPKKIFWNISTAVFALGALFLVVNLFTGFIFYIDELNYYQRGSFFLFSQIPAGVILIILCTILVRFKDYLMLHQKLIIASCVVLPTIAELIQVIVYGFSWLALSMDIACFILLAHYMTTKNLSENERGNQNDNGQKIKTRLAVIGIIIGVLFFGAVTRITLGVANNQLSEEVYAHYDMMVKKITAETSKWINGEYQAVNSYKNNIVINDNYDQEYLAEYFKNIIENNNADKLIYDVYYVTTENVISSGQGLHADSSIDYRKEDWYINAYSVGGIQLSQPYKDGDLDQNIVTISTRVFDKSGKLRGVLAVDVFVDELFNIFARQEMPEDSYMIITDQDMKVISAPLHGHLYDDGKMPALRELSSEYKKLEDYIKSYNKTDEGIEIKDYDNVKRTFFAEKVDECSWYIIIAISSEVIKSTETTLTESIIVALIIYLVIGVILTLWATNGVIHKLQDARQEANAASEAKSKFLANMSHEIRTPINAVLGMDEILLRECKDEEIREYALNIQSAGQSLLGIINDILDFSKVESGKMNIVNNDYSLKNLINACDNLIKLRAREKGLVFSIERGEYLPSKLNGDENKIRQIIANVLTNAVKYTKSGSVKMRVDFDKTSEKEGVLKVTVKDTGIGIKKESMEDLFDSFQRLDESKNRNIEGTGLGLSITKRLVELMNGIILVESVYGEGSTFTVSIPQKIIDSENIISFEKEETQSDNGKSAEINEKEFEGRKVLVVDDVAMNHKVFKGLLKNTGLLIDVALNGNEAIQDICENDYDIIFLDHMMPEKDGIETFNEMKKNHASRIENVPIIMLTANAIEGSDKEYLALGFDGYLSKPVNRNDLMKCLKDKLL